MSQQESHTQIEKAEQVLATSKDPDELAWAHLFFGGRHEGTHSWELAIESYSAGIAANASDPRVQYFCNNNLGFCLIQLGRFMEAKKFCDAAIEINADQHNAHKNLGLAQQGAGEFLDAAICFVNAARLSPSDPRSLRHLEHLIAVHPEILTESDKLRQAVEDLRQSVKSGSRAQFH